MAPGGGARGGARGGRGIQASSQVRARLGAAAASLAGAAGVAGALFATADDYRSARGGVVLGAVVVLALALAWPFPSLVPWPLVLLAGVYAWNLGDGSLDQWAPVYAGGLLVVAELAYWSLELRGRAHDAVRLIERRSALVALLSLAAVAAGGVVLSAAAIGVGSGVATDLLGVAAAVTALGAVAVLARR